MYYNISCRWIDYTNANTVLDEKTGPDYSHFHLNHFVHGCLDSLWRGNEAQSRHPGTAACSSGESAPAARGTGAAGDTSATLADIPFEPSLQHQPMFQIGAAPLLIRPADPSSFTASAHNCHRFGRVLNSFLKRTFLDRRPEQYYCWNFLHETMPPSVS